MFIIRLKNYCSALFLFAFLIVACPDKTRQSVVALEIIEEHYGVSINEIADVHQLSSISVMKMNQGIADVKITPPTKKEYYQYINIVKNALEKYPVSVVRKHLKQIGIGGPCSENGGTLAGQYDKDKIYLFCNRSDDYSSEVFLEQTIHHEFSSILIHHYDFPALDWLDLNPKDFEYIIKPSKINAYMNSIQRYHADETQLRQGLVSSYGKANAENDINSYVELIFTQPEKIKTYIEQYPRIGLKYKMIKEFYLSISPDFSRIFSRIN